MSKSTVKQKVHQAKKKTTKILIKGKMPKIKMTTTTKSKKKHIPFGSDVNDQQNLASINTKINWLSTNILYTQKEKTNHKSNQENYRNKKLILVNY